MYSTFKMCVLLLITIAINIVVVQSSSITSSTTKCPPKISETLQPFCYLSSLGLQSLWTFNQHLTDALSMKNLTSSTRNVLFVADRKGAPNAALFLNGTNMKLPPAVYFSGGDFTISSWVNMQSYKYWTRLLDCASSDWMKMTDSIVFALSYVSSGRPELEIFKGYDETYLSMRTSLPLNAWTHMAATFVVSSTATIYTNGTVTASDNLNTTYDRGKMRKGCYIGRSFNNKASSFMYVDDLMIFSRALNADQVIAVMNTYLPESYKQVSNC